MRYKAFISYSHTQRGLARGLQDALYRFGTPWHQRTGALIFRDESGLAANPDLWGTLRAALDESRRDFSSGGAGKLFKLSERGGEVEVVSFC